MIFADKNQVDSFLFERNIVANVDGVEHNGDEIPAILLSGSKAVTYPVPTNAQDEDWVIYIQDSWAQLEEKLGWEPGGSVPPAHPMDGDDFHLLTDEIPEPIWKSYKKAFTSNMNGQPFIFPKIANFIFVNNKKEWLRWKIATSVATKLNPQTKNERIGIFQGVWEALV